MNSNLDLVQQPKHYINIFIKKFIKRIPMIFTEPLTFVTDLYIWLKRLTNYLLKVNNEKISTSY